MLNEMFYFRTYATVHSQQLISKKQLLIILRVHLTIQATVHKRPKPRVTQQ